MKKKVGKHRLSPQTNPELLANMAVNKKKAIEDTGASIAGPKPWVYVLLLLLVYWGINYLDGHSGGFNAKVYAPHKNAIAVANLRVVKSPDELAYEKGQSIYSRCAACHQANGLGNKNLNYPPLAGSEWVLNESPNWVIAIVLKGLMGPIEVKGETYNNVMAAQGGGLSDEDLANVITYIRRNADWGNDPNLPLVTPDQVKSVREEIDARPSMFTVEDLLKLYPRN